MFCYQCEQTFRGSGCVEVGVCGKAPSSAALQDLLVHALKGVGQYAHRARQFGVVNLATDRFVIEAMFNTLTNVNFDDARLETLVRDAIKVRDAMRVRYEEASAAAGQEPEKMTGAGQFIAAESRQAMVVQGELVSVAMRTQRFGADIASTQELLTYGLKGLAAYADHALVLDVEDDGVYAFFHEALDALTKPDLTLEEILGLCLKVGEVNFKVMELLDGANTGTFGHPVPTAVRIHPVKGKAIVVSGHDLKDLEVLLQQTAGKGINVYTHGEMLPGHGYPGLKKYPHLVGNYGGAWQDQAKEFEAFPGAILMTTNCIQQPRPTYQERLFTCGQVGWPDVKHISDRNFAPVIEAALAAPGFLEDGPDKTILVGFGHNTVLGVAPQVIEAVKSGALRHFFLIGGCDGARPGRDYYAELADSVPQDCAILTLACGKYRFNKHEFGTIGGLPRMMDMGQCNDAYSAIRVAIALAEAFECGVNDLPLSMILSWYEQKAVAILLTLLHLGVKNVKIGPSLPAFITPTVLNILVENYGLAPISTPEADLAATLA